MMIQRCLWGSGMFALFVLLALGFAGVTFANPVGDWNDDPPSYGTAVALDITCMSLGKETVEPAPLWIGRDTNQGLVAISFQKQELTVLLVTAPRCIGTSGFIWAFYDLNQNGQYDANELLALHPISPSEQSPEGVKVTIPFLRPTPGYLWPFKPNTWLRLNVGPTPVAPVNGTLPVVLSWGGIDTYYLAAPEGQAPFPVYTGPQLSEQGPPPACNNPPCESPPPPPPPPSCQGNCDNNNGGDKDKDKCNSGGGNGSEGCDPGASEGKNCGGDESSPDKCKDKDKDGQGGKK